jgi:nucleoid-associated protein YgaU
LTVSEARKAFDDAAKALLDAYGQVIPTKLVTVLKGDTLWSLAARELGSGGRWAEIYWMNLDVIKANQAGHSLAGEFSNEYDRDFVTKLSISPSTIYAGQKLLVMVP